jgi:hypothetical protein
MVNINYREWPFSSDHCFIIYEHDSDFGDTGFVDSVVSRGHGEGKKPSEHIDASVLLHSTTVQHNELLYLLDEIAAFFKGAKLCETVGREIPTTPDFVPKRLKGFCITEALLE